MQENTVHNEVAMSYSTMIKIGLQAMNIIYH